MRILIAGASGFIGSALADALARRGHEVVRVGRGAAADLQADFAAVPSRQWWEARLAGVDAVVNAVGILREQGGQRFDALHTRAPIELFHACAAARVGRIVQVSALGADAHARSRYHLSKKAADDALRALPVAAAIVQPSLVYGPGGSSAALFDGLALAPLLMLPGRGRMQVQPVHLRDVVDGIVALLESPVPRTGTFAFAGAQPQALRDYLGELRARLGTHSPLRVLGMPAAGFRFGARLAGLLPGSMLDAETADMLLRGNATQDNALPALLDRPLTPVGRFLSGEQVPAARTQALLFWWLPALRIAIALVWLWTGVVSLGLYPVQESYALLARVGLHGAAATIALYGAAGLDLAFGALALLAPPAWRRRMWPAQAALIAGYTVLITLFLPEYWLHPYGPLSKNLPLLASIGLLWALEPRKH
jgi:uncharacterized protein YbjT (DUF2867 family)